MAGREMLTTRFVRASALEVGDEARPDLFHTFFPVIEVKNPEANHVRVTFERAPGGWFVYDSDTLIEIVVPA